jgi:hypothetical protein
MAIKNGEWVKFEGTQEDAENQLRKYAGKLVLLLIKEDEQYKIEVARVRVRENKVTIYNDQPNAKEEDSVADAICYSSTGVYPLPPKEFFVDETEESQSQDPDDREPFGAATPIAGF